jgi:hypothetical protein
MKERSGEERKKKEEKKKKEIEKRSRRRRPFCTCLEAEASCFTLVLADSGVPVIWSSMRRHHPAY